MTREPNKFQIHLTDTVIGATDVRKYLCARCRDEIEITEDPEHVAVYPALTFLETWRFHPECFADVVTGMLEFYKVFIIEKRKKVVLQ